MIDPDIINQIVDASEKLKEAARKYIEILSDGEMQTFDCYNHLLIVKESAYIKCKKLFEKAPSNISIRIVQDDYLPYLDDIVIISKNDCLLYERE